MAAFGEEQKSQNRQQVGGFATVCSLFANRVCGRLAYDEVCADGRPTDLRWTTIEVGIESQTEPNNSQAEEGDGLHEGQSPRTFVQWAANSRVANRADFAPHELRVCF